VSNGDFTERLRAELVAAADRMAVDSGRPRRRRVVLLATAAAILLVAGLAVNAARPTSARADVVVGVRDGRMTVRLVDVESRARLIESVLRDKGLDVDVVSIAVGPSLVGRFVRVRDSDIPIDVRPIDDTGPSFAGFSVALGFRGHLDLVVGRPAGKGEPYAAFSDAYAPGESLACSAIYGMRVADVLRVLDDHHVHAAFQPFAKGTAVREPMPPEMLAGHGYDDWIVTDAHATSASTVLIALTIDGSPPTDPPLSDDRGACHR
jgi:hypothetical protein